MRIQWIFCVAPLALASAAGSASAAEISPGGDLDIKLKGSLRSGFVFGGDEVLSGSDPGYGFSTDHRFEILVSGKDDASQTEYGGRFRLRLDNGRTNLVDRSYLYLRGSYGEVQFGNQKGVTDDDLPFVIGSFSIAAGTGGMDGDQPGQIVRYELAPSGQATKINYLTPTFGGLQAGLSFTPDTGANGLISSIDDSDGDTKNMLEGGVRYDGTTGPLGFGVAVVATAGKNETSGNDVNGISAGFLLEYSDWGMAGSYGTGDEDGENLDYWNVGIGWKHGPLSLSTEYGASSEGNVDPDIVIFSTTIKLMPGVSFRSDVEYADPDTSGDYIAGLLQMRIDF